MQTWIPTNFISKSCGFWTLFPHWICLPWRDEKEPSSIRSTSEMFRRQHWEMSDRKGAAFLCAHIPSLNCPAHHNWLLTTLWVIGELSQYPHPHPLNQSARPCTNTFLVNKVWTKHVTVLFSKMMAKHCGTAQFQPWVWTHYGVVYFACLSGWRCLSPDERSTTAAWKWLTSLPTYNAEVTWMLTVAVPVNIPLLHV